MCTGSDNGLRRCPVCCSTEGKELSYVAPEVVWEALHKEFGTELPECVRERHAPAGQWRLHACAVCGLQWFGGAVQGDAEFYARLTDSPRYYEAERWEFAVVRAEIGAEGSVADIGCGSGAFLLSLPRSVQRTGLDHNARVLAALRAADPAVVTVQQDVLEYARDRPGKYDAVTAFHVLEHVEEPVRLLSSARALVAPGGAVFVSVPHINRTGYGEFEVLDNPPHHLTRWSRSPLERAAGEAGLRLVAMWLEPPDSSVRIQVLTNTALRRLRRVPVPLRRQGVRVWRRVGETRPVRVGLLRTGFYERRGVTGHTVLARLLPV